MFIIFLINTYYQLLLDIFNLKKIVESESAKVFEGYTCPQDRQRMFFLGKELQNSMVSV